MFIAQAYRAKNDFWRYLTGSLLVGGSAIIGQLLFSIAILLKIGYGDDGNFNLNNFDKLSTFDQNDLMNVFDSNLTFALILSSFLLGFIVFVQVVKHLHKQPLMQVTTTRKKFDWSRFFFAFALVALFSIGSTLIDYYFNPEEYIFNFKPVTFLILFVLAVLLIPIQTSLEEYVFRGYLMQGFGILAKNRWFPLIMTSVIFGGMHFANPEVTKLGYILMVYYIGTGFLLGIMTLMDEGMELSLGFHAANNLITALLVTADWQVFQTEAILISTVEPTAGVDVLIPVLIVYPIFLAILAYRFGWTNWKEKLFGKIDPPTEESNPEINSFIY